MEVCVALLVKQGSNSSGKLSRSFKLHSKGIV